MAGTTAKTVTEADGGWEKVDVPEPAVNLVWENIGDQFVGEYEGEEKAGTDSNGRSFSKYIFTDDQGIRVAVSQTVTVREGMTRGRVRPGDAVRLTYVSDTDTGADTPRRDITVEVKRGTRAKAPVNGGGGYRPGRTA